MNEKVARALDHVDEKYIVEAGKRKKRRPHLKIAAAVILALVMIYHTPSIPLVVSAKAVSLASESRKMERPNIHSDEFDRWISEREQRDIIVAGAVPSIANFAENCSREVLTGVDDVNRLWSPVNAYLALAMTAELTAGSTQKEVLDVLGVPDVSELRTRMSAVWEDIYRNDGREISVLANSLWLDDEVTYQQEVMDLLSHHYYASVYQGDLGSERTNSAMTNWLNNQTGGFLKDRTGSVKLYSDPAVIPMLAMASTIYFQGQWNEKFNSGMNTQRMFHAASGDTECTFMNTKESHMGYYWGEDYGAVQLYLANGSSMWFILPDEDKTVDDVLLSGEYMEMVSESGEFSKENEKWMKVNLSVPQFDVSASMDLKEGLRSIGLEKIFNLYGNDFSPSMESELPVYLSSINQDTRVAIDEEGVTAASYVILEFGAGGAAPPDEVIDFVLDRPFVFAISYDRIPLFVGTVNTP